MAYAAMVYLMELLEEKVIHFLERVLKAEKGKAIYFYGRANEVLDSLNQFRILKDVPYSFLARLKKRLQPDESGALPDLSNSHSVSSIVNHLDGVNYRLENFMQDLDGGVIAHPSATLSQEREFANDLLLANREVKEVITQVESAIFLCKKVVSLLQKINDSNSDEVFNTIKTAADKASDSIEDLSTGTTFSSELKDFMKFKSTTYDLLVDIDQLLSHSLEEQAYFTKRFMKDGLMKGINQLPLPTSGYASSSQRRLIKDHMLKDIDQLTPYTFEKGSSFQGEKANDSTDLHLGDDLQWLTNPTYVDNEEDVEVGMGDYIRRIIDELTGPTLKLTTVTIVGMGGIGKTTLAKKVFHHPNIFNNFHRLAWVNSVSNVDQVLTDLLNSIPPINDEIHGQSREDKGKSLWQRLRKRKYLVIVDGLWDFEAWDVIQRFFPDDEVGSRILITTRVLRFPTNTGMNIPKNSPHCFFMRPLDENQSWQLLEKKLFGKQKCPVELVAIGKQIAEKCGGLPLAIVVIAGTLINIPRSYSSWSSVMDIVNPIISDKPESCLDIIALSYSYLPHRLKSCFLLMGAFPAHCEIEVEKLINLWMAQGFFYDKSPKYIEGENCLKELLCRSLVLISKISLDGKIKTCLLHDLVRQVCLREAQKENFMHVFESNANDVHGAEKQRHLIFNMDNCADIPILPPLPHLRSFMWLTLGSGFTPGMVLLQLSGFKWLRVLDMYFLSFDSFPNQILNLENLRYLALNVTHLFNGRTISVLKKLQTLLIYGPWIPRESERNPTLRFEFREMPCLSHLHIWTPCFLKYTSIGKHVMYPNHESCLQSLSTITFSSCTKSAFSSMSCLQKLGVFETKEDYHKNGASIKYFESFCLLTTLDVLKCSFYKENKRARSLDLDALPISLKKLTLSGCRLSWDKMKFLARLPILETLKLKNGAFQGPEWVLTSETFHSLKQLLIDNTDLMYWKAESHEHFPCLERLVLRYCKSLGEIPWGVGELSVLKSIELHYCSEPAENSARGYQEKYGNPKVIIRSTAKF